MVKTAFLWLTILSMFLDVVAASASAKSSSWSVSVSFLLFEVLMAPSMSCSHRFVGSFAAIVKLARLMASGKAGLSILLPWQNMFPSVVAVGSIEKINESSSRFITRGQQIVASPIVAASNGTGMI